MKRLLMFILMCLITFSFVGCGKKQGTKEKLEVQIWKYIQPKVSENLKSPESAEYPDYSEAVIELSNGKYHVVGYVKAPNGLGIMGNQCFETFVDVSDAGEITGMSEVSYIDLASYDMAYDAFSVKKEKEEKNEKLLTGSELENALLSVDLAVTSTSIIAQEEMYVASGDFLSAVFKNNQGNIIQSCQVAYVGWDANGIPLKLGNVYLAERAYIYGVEYDNVNLKEGDSYGEECGLYVDEALNVKTIKAIVVSYKALDGSTWTNPYFADFYYEYVGKEIK